MTVFECIRRYLEENKYEGLCMDGCGCALDDLAPCEEIPIHECVAAYKLKPCEKIQRGEFSEHDCPNHGPVMGTEKGGICRYCEAEENN